MIKFERYILCQVGESCDLPEVLLAKSSTLEVGIIKYN